MLLQSLVQQITHRTIFEVGCCLRLFIAFNGVTDKIVAALADVPFLIPVHTTDILAAAGNYADIMTANDSPLREASTHTSDTPAVASDCASIIATNDTTMSVAPTYAADIAVCAYTDNCAKVGAFFDVAVITIPAHAADRAVVRGADDCAFVDAAGDGAVFIPSTHTADIISGTEVGIYHSNVLDEAVGFSMSKQPRTQLVCITIQTADGVVLSVKGAAVPDTF